MATLLIVEDDKHTNMLTVAKLSKKYQIISCTNGDEALKIIYNQKIDLIVSDIMMPKLDGYQLVETLRADGFDVPILLLTAKHELEDKKIGFSLGTDDYLVKPIDYDELIWRIDALLRRAKINADYAIQIGDTIINSKTLTVTSHQLKVELSKKEFDLLFKLLSYPNIVFTKVQLLDDIWGIDSESGEDTIKTHISKLRNKLKVFTDFKIVTVKGIGYKGEINE